MRLPNAFLARPIAHRALHDRDAGRAENALPAIRAAIAGGYGIEIDVQPSSDGVPMVFHDDALDRLTGETGPITARTADALARIPLLGDSTTIPTLAQVLAEVAGQVPLLIEIKDQDGAMGEDVGRLEDATARALQDYQGPVALMSFNPYSVMACARAAPGIPRGIVTDPYAADDWPDLPSDTRAHLARIPDYDRSGACFVSHKAADLASPRVAEIKSAGAHVLCWTIRSAEAEREARRIAHNVTFEGYRA